MRPGSRIARDHGYTLYYALDPGFVPVFLIILREGAAYRRRYRYRSVIEGAPMSVDSDPDPDSDAEKRKVLRLPRRVGDAGYTMFRAPVPARRRRSQVGPSAFVLVLVLVLVSRLQCSL